MTFQLFGVIVVTAGDCRGGIIFFQDYQIDILLGKRVKVFLSGFEVTNFELILKLKLRI